MGARKNTGQAALILEPLIVETPSQEKSMTLQKITRTVIGLVENASGGPVVVTQDASLKILAAPRIGEQNSHDLL